MLASVATKCTYLARENAHYECSTYYNPMAAELCYFRGSVFSEDERLAIPSARLLFSQPVVDISIRSRSDRQNLSGHAGWWFLVRVRP